MKVRQERKLRWFGVWEQRTETLAMRLLARVTVLNCLIDQILRNKAKGNLSGITTLSKRACRVSIHHVWSRDK